ncbi:hypothetical protein [Pelovirga terrestris]|uniref:Uncharacterized protein n=1 Tax=Pelovirga terrestris TaxID=2771352 RepID=A0A8J6QYA1_9BACT|nr:hypothetical protein [Pelovirga terrestris]MBD1401073.1 hypothetical protein [Pelovirga terrestris]
MTTLSRITNQLLARALKHLYAIDIPGTIVDLSYVWRRHNFNDPPLHNSKE